MSDSFIERLTPVVEAAVKHLAGQLGVIFAELEKEGHPLPSPVLTMGEVDRIAAACLMDDLENALEALGLLQREKPDLAPRILRTTIVHPTVPGQTWAVRCELSDGTKATPMGGSDLPSEEAAQDALNRVRLTDTGPVVEPEKVQS